MMSNKERTEHVMALGQWLEQRGLTVGDASTVAAQFMGITIATLAPDHKEMKIGLRNMYNAISESAENTWEAIKDGTNAMH